MQEKVFISYRRSDSVAYAGRLLDYLSAALGPDAIVRLDDFSSPGTDFRDAIKKAISASAVCVVLIGQEWAAAFKNVGDNDFVLAEIEDALDQQIEIIPVLVDDARMPR